MQPLVSILIPAYNAQEFLAETIQSAIGQTWPHKEIIVVDDGSRDGTLAIARRYESEILKVITQQNQGAAAARNRAYAEAQGDYIQWLDADDLLSANKIETQVRALGAKASKLTLLSSPWASFQYRASKAKFVPTLLWEDLSPVEWMTRKMENNLHMQTATWLVSRELTELAGPWNTRLLSDDDGEYFGRVMAASEAIRFVNDAAVYYRVTPSGRLSEVNRDPRKLEALMNSIELNIECLLRLADSPRARAACVTYIQTWLPAFYGDQPELTRRAQELAESLGGSLRSPNLGWKYSWIQKCFGWSAARTSQLLYNQMKTSVQRKWDKVMLLRGESPTLLKQK